MTVGNPNIAELGKRTRFKKGNRLYGKRKGSINLKTRHYQEIALEVLSTDPNTGKYFNNYQKFRQHMAKLCVKQPLTLRYFLEKGLGKAEELIRQLIEPIIISQESKSIESANTITIDDSLIDSNSVKELKSPNDNSNAQSTQENDDI